MNLKLLIPLLLLIFSCANKNTEQEEKSISGLKNESIGAEFQRVLDSADVHGSILIYDLENDKFYSNDFEWAQKGKLPASTFKIANSIIALETGVTENDSTILEWNGEKRSLEIWEQDLIFRDAFHFSCVPCYKEIAREIGTSSMNQYLDKLAYGSMKVDSSNIDIFWLEGDSRISQFQQIDFLKRLYQSELPISDRTELLMKRMMLIEENEHYKLSGKTGWSIKNGDHNGWFVGYLEKDEKVYFFATNVEPNEAFNMDRFPLIRKSVTYDALKHLKLMR